MDEGLVYTDFSEVDEYLKFIRQVGTEVFPHFERYWLDSNLVLCYSCAEDNRCAGRIGFSK